MYELQSPRRNRHCHVANGDGRPTEVWPSGMEGENHSGRRGEESDRADWRQGACNLRAKCGRTVLRGGAQCSDSIGGPDKDLTDDLPDVAALGQSVTYPLAVDDRRSTLPAPLERGDPSPTCFVARPGERLQAPKERRSEQAEREWSLRRATGRAGPPYAPELTMDRILSLIAQSSESRGPPPEDALTKI